MKKLFVIAAMAAIATGASAQKSELSKARAAFDASSKVETYKTAEGKEAQRTVIVPEKLEETKAMLAKAKEAWDATLAKGKEVKPEVIAMGYDIKGDLYQRIMGQELNHAAAKEPLDTMLFYTSLTDCLDAYEECYKNDEKGQYTAKNKSNLIKFRQYYMYCGQFFSQSGRNTKAAEAFKKWLDFPQRYTLVAGEESVINDPSFDRGMVSYYAALSLYQAKDYAGMAAFEKEALGYEKEAENVRQLYLVSVQEQGDTARWEQMVRQYVKDGVASEGVIQNMMAHYFSSGKTDDVLAFAKDVEQYMPTNKMGGYAQGIVMMNQNKYDEAIACFKRSLEIDPDYGDALYNIGVCLCNQGIALNSANVEKKFNSKAAAEAADEEARKFFREAEPYFLRVQELMPDQPQRWAYRLQSIYTVLGNKEKQKEYEALAGE